MFHSPDLRVMALPGDASGVVTVWEVDLAVDDERARLLGGWLSEPERVRAARFRFDSDRRRYTVARGRLRELIGARLGLHPAIVRFQAGPHGKPALAQSSPALGFNVSHSGDRALIALAIAEGGQEVGVDLESAARLGDARDLPALAARTLHPADLAGWQALPEGARAGEFLRAWTRLEAFGKATGGGLGHVLGKVSLARWPDVAPGWRGWDLPVGAGWGGALVVGSPPG